ncbi:FecCD family ABC transporter permease [Mangrovicoccus algicola]|uniref:Iron ABC transporter permease n=1 Tax=Mangrovicoccus algicola TaxID=2771008 RepID=A0A8J7CVC0_9RHOB|nr:iron ABC transporter permease [Mangrovicoccus algicola]MBE3638564.1 iron ABC transporter permease [Mangrovicoccus algicola]
MSDALAPRRRRRLGWMACALAVLAVLVLASLALGSRAIPPGQTLAALRAFDPGNDLHLIIRELRLPRTCLAVLAGAALGLAGAMVQAVTRNPMAEPGLLGINGGAAVAVVLGIAVLGLTEMRQYVWLGFAGAGLAGAAVFLCGGAHRAGTDPVRLLLAGAGLSVVLGSVTTLVILNAQAAAFDTFRNWAAGSVEGRGMAVAGILALALLAGGGLALALAGSLNGLALGQDLGQALGVRPGRVWGLACLSVMLLAGGATAAAGPIAFVGLVAPHLARAVCGPDHRWILPFAAIFAAILLLLSDIVGRLVAMPSEVAAGIVATLLGGPVFVHVARRFRLARL